MKDCFNIFKAVGINAQPPNLQSEYANVNKNNSENHLLDLEYNDFFFPSSNF